jgi:hypothetical protein
MLLLSEDEIGRKLGTFKKPCFSENLGAVDRIVLSLFINVANKLGGI